MMPPPAEIARRIATRMTGRIHSLPVLALSVHTACNCRCIMCDIWKANAQGRELTLDELRPHLEAIRRLRVQRVMLTGGEPLLHRNLWALCGHLREQGSRVTLVTTGLLIARHVHEIAEHVDELVVSIDGPPDLHDTIRRVKGGFERVAHGIGLLRNHTVRPRIIARCVVQRSNHARLAQAIDAVADACADGISLLAADVTSTAFNRPEPWDEDRRGEVALSRDQLVSLVAAIGEVEERCREHLDRQFVVGGIGSLWRIYDYYSALAGLREFPRVRCNAPWVSAVLEPGGLLRPCFFHPPYPQEDTAIDQRLNAPAALAFRRQLDPQTNPTCQRCVCTLSLPPWREV